MSNIIKWNEITGLPLEKQMMLDELAHGLVTEKSLQWICEMIISASPVTKPLDAAYCQCPAPKKPTISYSAVCAICGKEILGTGRVAAPLKRKTQMPKNSRCQAGHSKQGRGWILFFRKKDTEYRQCLNKSSINVNNEDALEHDPAVISLCAECNRNSLAN